MLRMTGILFIVLVFGCSVVPAPPVPIIPTFPYPCDGPYKGRKLSEGDVEKVLQAHKKWLTDSKDPKGEQANFCGAKLSYGKFQLADLKYAVFQMAMLEGADFTEAYLNEAQLQGANLSGANFSHAHLAGTDLDDAMLHLASFQNTDLGEASLQHAMLYQADFHQAKLIKTKLQGAGLRDVKNLTQSQINMACLNRNTILPKDLTMPEPCSEKTRD